MLNADKLAFNDPKTGLKSMSKPCVTLLSSMWERYLTPERSWDPKKIFGQSPALFQSPKWVDRRSWHSARVVALHLGQALSVFIETSCIINEQRRHF